MSAWQVGDLALCKSHDGWRALSNGASPPGGGPRSGQILTVTGVHARPGWPVLVFAEFPRAGFEADQFHRIPPHQFDEEDLETVNLMKRAPAPAVPQ